MTNTATENKQMKYTMAIRNFFNQVKNNTK